MDPFFPEFLTWRNAPFEICTLRCVPKNFMLPFRKIDGDFGGTISWNTQPNSSIRQPSLYHQSFSVFCLADRQPFVPEDAFCHKICILSVFCNVDIREDAKSHMTSHRCGLCTVFDISFQ